MHTAEIDFSAIAEGVAQDLLGDPNPALSNARELRYGTRGSLAIDLDKGVWHDHENGEGGGILELIQRKIGGGPGEAIAWLRERSLIPPEPAAPSTTTARGRIVEIYDYRDETGRLLYQVVRYAPKEFRPRSPDGRGGWIPKRGDRRVPYRLPELLAADPDDIVFITEGEKDANALGAHGLPVTCNDGGAGKWPAEFARYLQGRRAVALADNDAAGRSHARKVCDSLRRAGIPAAVLELPDLPPKGDVSDWLAKGGTPEALIAMAGTTLGAGTPAAPLRSAIKRVELAKGNTAAAVDDTLAILRKDPAVFDFGGQLALVERGQAHPLCEHALAHHLGQTVQYWRTRKDGAAMVEDPTDPPPALLKQILALGERRKLNPLEGVVTGPTIRQDGTVLTTPGYDAATRLLFDPMGVAVPEVPMSPTEAEARAALDTLMRPFDTFPFVDATARGAMLASLLTAAVRPVLPTAPAFAFDAPVQGSGKTLLARCVGVLMEGRDPDIWPHTAGRDDEETRKRLFTMLRSGARALVWDNITGTFDSASLAAFLTASALVDRVLGRSESLRIPNRALLLLTGNNLTLAGDMPRRVIVCRIDPETDQPFARRFELNPLAHVLDNRMEMLAAACTLMRARFARPVKGGEGRLASFEAWDELVRQTVVWCDTMLEPGGFGDPMVLVAEAQAADPDAEALHALLEALRGRFGEAEFTAKQVLDVTRAGMIETDLAAAIKDIAGDNGVRSAKSLGRVLKFREGRIVQGLRLTGRRDTHAGAMFYRVTG